MNQALKCLYDQILDIHFVSFCTIGLNFLDILPNFNLLRILQHTFLDLHFREFSAAINFPCSNSWLKIGVNDVILSKYRTDRNYNTNYYSNSHEEDQKLWPLYSCNFNQSAILENMTSFTPIFNQEIIGGRRFTEIKVQKTCALYFVID